MLSDDLSLADYAKGLLVMYALLDTMLEERSSELAKIKCSLPRKTQKTDKQNTKKSAREKTSWRI